MDLHSDFRSATRFVRPAPAGDASPLDPDDARELVLAHWRSRHPVRCDNLEHELVVFVEQIMALAPERLAFHHDSDRRRLIRGWIEALEAERLRDAQSRLTADVL